MSSERILKPNMRKLLARVVARKAIPAKGGLVDGINLFMMSGKLAKVTQESLDWIDSAVQSIRSAPDNPYGEDEEIIAEAILSRLEKRE